MCAAPGGKSMQLIQAGAFITALDRSSARMKIVKENLKRMGMQANTIVADALEWQPNRAYDAILLDAPCSATGTWRRHPEMVQLVSPEKIAEMVAVQRALLQRAWSWLKVGGTLVYCVCSLEPEEGEAQAAWFMDEVKNAVLVHPHPTLSLSEGEGRARARGEGAVSEIPPECITPEGYLRTRPDMLAERGGMDGFFAASFRKAS